jgi:hypothetical protein
VRTHFPAIGIDGSLRLQEARFQHAKLRTRLLGMGAVEVVLGPGHPPEVLGELVRYMQPLLPDSRADDGRHPVMHLGDAGMSLS